MPQIDVIHLAVRRALEKQGWRIVTEHLFLDEGGYHVYVDLAVSPGSDLEGQGVGPIVVEVKSFLRPSFLADFQEALGQYLVYVDKLEALGDLRPLFLAVPQSVYDLHFKRSSIQRLTQRYQMHLLVIDTYQEEVVQWIN